MKKIFLILLVIVTAAISFWAGGHYGSQPSPSKGERTILYYVDPMTPGFRSDQPGIAPCGMPLEPVYADAPPGQTAIIETLPHGAVQVTPARQQLIGVKVAPVEIRPMIHNLRLYGRIVPDENRVYRVNASTDSWIRELSNVTTGSLVNKNQILAEALAPAFYNAQVTYLVAMDNVDRIKQQLGGELRHQQADLADNQIRMAVQSLQNLGITDAQVEQLANTRKARPYLQVRAPTRGVVLNRALTLNQWFRAGEEFYQIADISKVWVSADVFESEARLLRPGMSVAIKHAQLGKTFHARVSEALPLFDPVSKTLKVRIDVDNPNYDLRPEMFVDVEIPLTLPPSLHVTADAVIDSGTRTIVYVARGDGTFEPRQVDIGWKLGRQVEITGGLMPGEKVVVAGNFLIDSESRMKTAATGNEAKMSRDPVCGMEIDEREAQSVGRIVILGDQTYFFCSSECLQSFHADPEKYLGKQRGSQAERGPVPKPGQDPVCDMQVDPHHAENAGLFVTLDGTTYHFCSRDCMLRFLKEHKKYATKNPPERQTPVHPAAIPRMDHGQKQGAMEASREHQGVPSGWAAPRQDSPNTGKVSLPAPGLIDQDAPGKKQDETPPQDWSSGWGKFPGAEYLGLKQRRSVQEQQQQQQYQSPAANGKNDVSVMDQQQHPAPVSGSTIPQEGDAQQAPGGMGGQHH